MATLYRLLAQVLTSALFHQLLIGQPFAIDTIQWTGATEDRINIVFFGDGYLDSQLEKYNQDVKDVVDHFFSQSPFREYRTYFNIIAFQIPSNEAGASLDPASPLDTYFASSFNSQGIERLLVATRSDKALEILFEQFPLYDQAVLIVNSAKYGGSGGWLATTSTNEAAPEIALHEIGHSFAGLSDEYWAGPQFARETPNMTQETDREKIRWKNWLGFEAVDVFPHSGDASWFKPHFNCKMQVLNPAFCPVCLEAITKRIQNLVNPTLGFSPEESEVLLTQDTQSFLVDLLKPNPNTFDIQWLIDGDAFYDQVSNIALTEFDVNTGNHHLEVIYRDTTAFVRDVQHQQANIYSINWTLTSLPTTTTTESTLAGWSIYPNPTSDVIRIHSNSSTRSAQYQLRDKLGRLMRRGEMTGDAVVPLAGLPPGIYRLIILEGSSRLALPFVRQ